MSAELLSLELPLPLFGHGKVRETYDLGDRLLMVTTDRLSAFDVILSRGIPHKGEILNRLAAFWFNETSSIIENHLITIDPKQFPAELKPYLAQLAGRSMIVRKAKRIDFECVVRGYLAGSGWKEYQSSGRVCGITLPERLRQSERLPEPIFTPATKSEQGHDYNCTFDEMANVIGTDLADHIRAASLNLYVFAAEMAIDRGIIIADTKFEFGLLDDRLIVIDEMLTPDSSRFWAAGEYQVGTSPASFDKQFIRDWLEEIGWNKEPPSPAVPDEIIDGVERRYCEAYEWLTGQPFVPMIP